MVFYDRLFYERVIPSAYACPGYARCFVVNAVFFIDNLRFRGCTPMGQNGTCYKWIGFRNTFVAVTREVANIFIDAIASLETYLQGVRAKFDTFCFRYISELLQDIDIG